MAKGWVVDVVSFLLSGIVILIGASVYQSIEGPHERELAQNFTKYEENFQRNAMGYFGFHENKTHIRNETSFTDVWSLISNYSDRKASFDETIHWESRGAAFFCATIMTTIGYGTHYPSTQGGRIFTIFFTLVSIPTFFFALAKVSENLKCFGKKLLAQIVSKEEAENKNKNQTGKYKLSLFGILTFSFVITIIFAAGFDMIYQDWTFLDSTYFNVITLTTVGLGDYAPDPDGAEKSEMLAFGFYIVIGMASIGTMLSVLQDYIAIRTTKVASKKFKLPCSIYQNKKRKHEHKNKRDERGK